jgi:cell division transport system permease protein
MKYNKVKSSSTSSMMIVAIAGLSFIMGLFYFLFLGANTWGNHLTSQIKVYVYLDDSLNTSQINETILKIKSTKSINKNDAKFVSKDQTAKEFLASSHENYEELLGEINPFKNLVILGLNDSNLSTNGVDSLVNKIKSMPGIFDVSYPSNLLFKITPKLKLITSIVSLLMVMIIFWIYFQFSGFVKLQIHSNRILLKSMQLLGSTNNFIQKPYIFNALKFGIIGSILGYILINVVFYFITLQIPEIQNLIFNFKIQLILFVFIIVFSLLFSVSSTYLVLNKYFKNSIVNLI